TENEDKAPITKDLPETIDIIILDPEVENIFEIEANLVNKTIIVKLSKK
ncbi:5099_t:CDS:1, partial [Cetraspora pellucida]